MTINDNAAPGVPLEYVDETPRRPRRDAHWRRAEAALGHHFVSVVALEKALPRAFGDNQGWWSVHVEVNADWRQSGVVFDQNSPLLRAVRLEVIGCRSRTEGERLKAAIDEALGNREGDGNPLRARYRNLIAAGAFGAWWGDVMFDCVNRLTDETPGFEIFTRGDHERMVEATARREMEKRGAVG